MRKNLIPKMSNTNVLKWYEKIKPIVRKDNKQYYFHTDLEPREVIGCSYTWMSERQMDLVKSDKLYVIKDVKMYHTYITHMTFAPTVAEVIKQIPRRIINKVVAFEILDCLNEVRDGHHISIVRLYGRKE